MYTKNVHMSMTLFISRNAILNFDMKSGRPKFYTVSFDSFQ